MYGYGGCCYPNYPAYPWGRLRLGTWIVDCSVCPVINFRKLLLVLAVGIKKNSCMRMSFFR